MRSYCFLFLSLLFITCKKEERGDDFHPVAKAGFDQQIVFPSTARLNGSASYDADDGAGLVSYNWSQFSGPSQSTILSPSKDTTTVKDLQLGTYYFVLTVKDKAGRADTDTVSVYVKATLQPNIPPVAKAGNDQFIPLGTTYTTLSGSGSNDPDGSIVSYLWEAITDNPPALVSPTAIHTNVLNLVSGVHEFELTVTDNMGDIGKDTIRVTVDSDSCILNRPVVNVQMIPAGNLVSGRSGLLAANAGNKILFAGGTGFSQTGNGAQVDILDISSNTWSSASLSIDRGGMAVASLGNKIFFAGGTDYYNLSYSRVDIYDVSTGLWSIAELSMPRFFASAVAVGNKILFAGGQNLAGNTTSLVDIYDQTTNTWSTANLSQARTALKGVSANGKAYFSGGFGNAMPLDHPQPVVDIFDPQTNTWSSMSMFEPKAMHTGISKAGKIYWAGGISSYLSKQVQIYDVVTQASTNTCLHLENWGLNAVEKDDNIIFFNGQNGNPLYFDIYNTNTKTWSIGKLPSMIADAAIISVNNVVYVAGGYNDSGPLSQVWKLQW